MSDPDTGDIEGLRPQEATDSDERGEDEYTDPPEDWKAADRWGTTPREQRTGEPLSLRLTEEQPEDAPPEPPEPPDRPVADYPLEGLREVDPAAGPDSRP